jgi:hypothetical protein
MDQLPHAPMCIAELIRDFALPKAIDEDGAQRLVLTVIGRGIGIQEEASAVGVIHGCALGCEVVSCGFLLRSVVSKREPQAKSESTQGFETAGKSMPPTGHTAESLRQGRLELGNMNSDRIAGAPRSCAGNCELISHRDNWR